MRMKSITHLTARLLAPPARQKLPTAADPRMGLTTERHRIRG